MKFATILILFSLASCAGDEFAAVTVEPADSGGIDGGAVPDATTSWDAGELGARDVLADPWPDDVEIERVADVIGKLPPICCYGVSASWGPCPANVSGQCATCATWMTPGICYTPPDRIEPDANTCENCYFVGFQQKLLCCTHGQGSGSDCPFPFENKGPVVHCGDCPCR